MKGNIISKGVVVVIPSLMYLVGFGLFIRSIGQSLFGSSGSGVDIAFSLLLSVMSCFIVGWFNSRSLVLAFLGAVITLLIGIPLSYIFLAPITEAIVMGVAPNTNIVLSGSFSAIWFVLTPIIIIEIVTDSVIQNKRWKQLAIGIIISILFMWGIEILTSNFGQNSRLDIGRLIVYAPVTWWLVTFSISYKKGDER